MKSISFCRAIPLLLSGLFAACGGATTPAESRPVPMKNAPVRIASNPDPASIAQDDPSRPVHNQGPTAPADPEIPVEPPPEPPMKVVLEADRDFLDQPLENPDSRRYKKWRQRGRIRVGQTHLDTVEVSADEAYLLVMSGMESTVRIYERETRRLVGNYSVAGFAKGSFGRGDVLFWPGMERGYAFLVGNTHGLALYSALTGELIEKLDDRSVWDMRWSPDGKYLVCNLSHIGTQTSKLTFFRRGPDAPLEEIKTIAMGQRVDAWALTRDNRYMAATYYPSNTLELIDLHSGKVLWTVAAPQYSNSVDFSPEGKRIAIGGNHLLVMDRDDPTHHATYKSYNNNIHRVRFSPSGDAVATSAYDGHVRIVSADPHEKKPKLLKDLRHGGTANVYGVKFVKDGAGLISSSGDKTVRYWGK